MFLPLSTNFTDEIGIERKAFSEYISKSRVNTPSTAKKSKKSQHTAKQLLSSRVVVAHLGSMKTYFVMVFLFSLGIVFFTSIYGIYHEQ
jgi:hypothetical protein